MGEGFGIVPQAVVLIQLQRWPFQVAVTATSFSIITTPYSRPHSPPLITSCLLLQWPQTVHGGFLPSLSIVTQTGRGTTNFENSSGWQTETIQQALWSSTKGACQKDGKHHVLLALVSFSPLDPS